MSIVRTYNPNALPGEGSKPSGYGVTGSSRSGRSRSDAPSSSDRQYDPLSDVASDDYYYNWIKQYQGSDFYEQLLNNPYLRGNNAEFVPNLGQSLLGMFGDDSAANQYYGDLLAKRNSYVAEILAQMREFKQDSPSSQASRMSAAGQNADLLGTSGVASAPENDSGSESFKPSEFNAAPGIEAIRSFAGICMQAYSFASGIAKDYISMRGMMADNAGKDADIASKMTGLVSDYIKSTTGSPSIRTDENGHKQYIFPDLSLDKLDSFAENNFSSRWARKRFKSAVKTAYGSAMHQFQKYGIINDAEKARKAMASALGDNMAFGLNYEAPSNNDPLIIASKEMSKAIKEVQELQLNASKAQEHYNSQYFHGLDASAASDAANKSHKAVSESYEAQKSARKVDQIINESIDRIISRLDKIANEGGLEGTLARGMILFYSAYRSNILPSLPTINIDRSSKTFVKSLNP